MMLPDLTVAILTYRRPDQLAANLVAVCVGIRNVDGAAHSRVLIVDNDPDGSAEEVAHRPWPVLVEYVHEPRPGIPAARNRALAESRRSRLLAFIDDDEIPEERWLVHLVETWRRTGADAVMGRVVSELPPDSDPYLSAGGFFNRPSRPTGTVLSAAATGNLLLDLDTVRRLQLKFDDRLGLAGGEDTVFTTQLARRGGLIVWCQESVTVDPVTPQRATRAWARRRAFSHGNVLQRTRLVLAPTSFARASQRAGGLAGGAARIAVGVAGWVAGVLARDLRHRVRGERAILRGAGVFMGSVGYQHHEYRRRVPPRR